MSFVLCCNLQVQGPLLSDKPLDLFPFAGSPGVFDLENDRQLPVEEIHDDPVVAMTRENYLELAYLKKDPVLSAEEEAELPEQFQLPDPEEDV
jgi:hypothetical protein